MKRILSSTRPSAALVISCIALFASLGGVSYAVATGSIDSREIKDDSVRGKDIRNNTVTAKELRRRSLDGTDIKIERVGGDAVKEQVLETEKLARVPRALNSDTLASQGPEKYSTRWALVNAAGQIERQTGGFSTVDCFSTNANCYINANEDVTNNGVHAAIASTNTGGGQLFGEIGAAPCGQAFVNCAPAGTENANVIVIAPRDSAGNPSPSRFYVYATGSEATP
ncbi:MAG: hypothetical protein ACR2LH_04015 [Thermoleophilaceae bacterium]